MSIESETPEPTEPNPPRWRWTKRLLAAGVVLTLLYIGAFQVWKYEANRRLQAEIDAIRARGEPVLVTDFIFHSVPDDQNAAVAYRVAQTNISSLPKKFTRFLYDFDPFLEIDQSTRQQLLELQTLVAPALAETRKARFQEELDWGVRYSSPTIQSYFSRRFGGLVDLAEAMCAAVFAQHITGNDSEAIETIRDTLRLASAINEQDPGLFARLVSIRLSDKATDITSRISHGLQIGPATTITTQPTKSASRAQVAALIRDLLDEHSQQDALKNAMYVERMMYIDSLTTSPAAAVGVSSLPAEGLWRPLFNTETVRLIRYTNPAIATANLPSYPKAVAGVRPSLESVDKWRESTGTTNVMQFSIKLLSSYDRLFSMHFASLAQRRAQAIALAIRLYQLDHDQAYPSRLDELVPTYLPQVPDDPFAADERPFGYQRTPFAMLISVGQNGTDDSGDLTPGRRATGSGDPKIPPGHVRDPDRFLRKDYVFLLGDPSLKDIPQEKPIDASDEDSEPSPQDPATQPATQPGE